MRSAHRRILSLLIAPLPLCALHSHAQGALTPPGAPAPMMKTLSQIEPRTAITNSGAVVISQPGAYYLTTNITVSSGSGIILTASNVDLDLKGFTVASTASPSGGYGIELLVNGLSDIAIHDGFIKGGVTNNGSGTYSGPGFQYGISYPGTSPWNVHVFNISVSGCAGGGIYLPNGGSTGNSTVIDHCTVKTVQGSGISADRVADCTAIDCGNTAISGTVVSGCRGESTSAANAGIFGSVVSDCYGLANGGDGVYGSVIHNSYGQSTSGNGVHALVSAQNCYGRTTSGTAGINAQNAIFCTGNHAGGAANTGFVGNGCIAESGTNNFSYKYNMP